jgi:hypothetical protein
LNEIDGFTGLASLVNDLTWEINLGREASQNLAHKNLIRVVVLNWIVEKIFKKVVMGLQHNLRYLALEFW